MTTTNTPTIKFLKIALIFGRPIALLGLFLVLKGLTHRTDETIAGGLLAIIIGFMVAWIGKIGLFWFR